MRKNITKELLISKGFAVTEDENIFLYDGVSYDIRNYEDTGFILDILQGGECYISYEETETVKVDKVESKKVPLEEIPFPLSSHNEILQDKKFPYNTYATLVLNSKFNKDAKENYIYDNNIGSDVMTFLKELEKNGAKVVSKRTIEKHIKVMLDSNIPLIEVRNTPNGIAYVIKSEKYYVKVPYAQVKELLVSTNKNMLKLFIFLKYMCNETEFKTIDRKFIAEHIGLSGNSCDTLNTISTMTTSLAKLGFIEIKQTTRKEMDEKGNKIVKTINSYRIRTFEEYKEITDLAKGKK